MAQLFRDQFEHWLNVATIDGSTENPSYKREGRGVESLSISFNAQTETYKDITQRTSTTEFQSYQLSSSISGKRCKPDDPVYDYLYNLKAKAISANTQLVEINKAKTNGTAGQYLATKYDVLITINEWLGDDVTISYDINYEKPVQGYATVSAGGITFTADAEPSY